MSSAPRFASSVVAFLVSCAAAGTAQAPSKRPLVTGIDHVAFRVSDRAAASRFYGEVLGLAPAVSRQTPASRLTFIVGRQRVLLEPGLPPGEDERLLHVAFETPDVAAMSAYLTSQRIEVTPVSQCQRGAIQVRDPDGHTIEFVPAEWPPLPSKRVQGRALSSRILHAGLTVREEAAAHRLYRDVLGFSEIWRGGRKEGVTQWVNMRVPDGTDYIEYMLSPSPPDRRQRGVLHHIALLVPDIQSAWEETVRRTPRELAGSLARPNVGVNGRWQLNLFDPDGTRTELMEPFTIR